MTKIWTIRTLIELAVIHDLIVHQMNVKSVFLNGDMDEEIYMLQPKSFMITEQENKACKLKNTLYGMKQSPKQWYEKFNDILVNNDFIVNESNSCVYFKIIG